jgi:TolB-like protein
VDKPFQAYTGSDPYVFVCYSHDDKALVYPELTRLHHAGFNVWYDEGIRPGSEWSDSIAERIEGCAAFVYFVTPRSVTSEHCRREVNFALEQSCSVLAIHLERTDLPGGLKLSLNNRQAIHRFDETLASFASKLQRALGSLSSSTPPRAASAGSRPGRPTVAVLPFANQSNDSEQEYFIDGISEDVLDGLGGNRGVLVRAWRSSLVFKADAADPREIAARLDVRYLVNGSVRKQGNRVRVTARLTDVVANTDVWSQRYDRELTDVFAVQDEITAAIVDALGVRLSGGARRTVEPGAYDAYLAGRFHHNRYEMESAVARYMDAIRIDPTYAEAYAAIAQVCATQVWLSPPNLEELAAQEQQFVAKALEQDPEQRLALGLKALRLPAQPAIDALDGLIRRNPSDVNLLLFYSFVMHRVGHDDHAAAVANRIVELDPLNPASTYWRGSQHVFCGRLAEGERDYETCERLGMAVPELRAQIALLQRDFETLEAQCARPPSDWQAAFIYRTVFAAYGAYLRHDRERLVALVSPLVADPGTLPEYIRHLLALLEDDLDAAAEHLESALERDEPYALFSIQGTAMQRSVFAAFYASERYLEILRRFELDPESVAKLSIPTPPF